MTMVSLPGAHDRRDICLNTDRIVSMAETDSYGVYTTITTDDGRQHAVGMRLADACKRINAALKEAT